MTPHNAAKFTMADLLAAGEKIKAMPAPPPDPIFVGDDFEAAKALIERGYHIICSPRVRTLLGEHLAD